MRQYQWIKYEAESVRWIKSDQDIKQLRGISCPGKTDNPCMNRVPYFLSDLLWMQLKRPVVLCTALFTLPCMWIESDLYVMADCVSTIPMPLNSKRRDISFLILLVGQHWRRRCRQPVCLVTSPLHGKRLMSWAHVGRSVNIGIHPTGWVIQSPSSSTPMLALGGADTAVSLHT